MWFEKFLPLFRGTNGSIEHLILRRQNRIFEQAFVRDTPVPDWTYSSLNAGLQKARNSNDTEGELIALLNLGIYFEAVRSRSSPEVPAEDYFDDALQKAESLYAPIDPNRILVTGYCASHYIAGLPSDADKLQHCWNALFLASSCPFLLRKSDAIAFAMAAQYASPNRHVASELWKRAAIVCKVGRPWKQSSLEERFGNLYDTNRSRYRQSTAFDSKLFGVYALIHLAFAELVDGIDQEDVLPLAKAASELSERAEPVQSWDVDQCNARTIDILMKIRQYDQAAAILERFKPIQLAIRANPANKNEQLDWRMQDPGLYLGICYEYSRQFDRALSAYKLAYDGLNESANAGGTYTMPIDICRGLLPRELENMARCCAALKNYDSAEKFLSEVITGLSLPKSQQANPYQQEIDCTDLALIQLQHGNVAKARLQAQQALLAWESLDKSRVSDEHRLAHAVAEKIVSGLENLSAGELFRISAPGTEPPECYCSARSNYSPHFIR